MKRLLQSIGKYFNQLINKNKVSVVSYDNNNKLIFNKKVSPNKLSSTLKKLNNNKIILSKNGNHFTVDKNTNDRMLNKFLELSKEKNKINKQKYSLIDRLNNGFNFNYNKKNTTQVMLTNSKGEVKDISNKNISDRKLKELLLNEKNQLKPGTFITIKRNNKEINISRETSKKDLNYFFKNSHDNKKITLTEFNKKPHVVKREAKEKNAIEIGKTKYDKLVRNLSPNMNKKTAEEKIAAEILKLKDNGKLEVVKDNKLYVFTKKSSVEDIQSALGTKKDIEIKKDIIVENKREVNNSKELENYLSGDISKEELNINANTIKIVKSRVEENTILKEELKSELERDYYKNATTLNKDILISEGKYIDKENLKLQEIIKEYNITISKDENKSVVKDLEKDVPVENKKENGNELNIENSENKNEVEKTAETMTMLAGGLTASSLATDYIIDKYFNKEKNQEFNTEVLANKERLENILNDYSKDGNMNKKDLVKQIEPDTWIKVDRIKASKLSKELNLPIIKEEKNHFVGIKVEKGNNMLLEKTLNIIAPNNGLKQENSKDVGNLARN